MNDSRTFTLRFYVRLRDSWWCMKRKLQISFIFQKLKDCENMIFLSPQFLLPMAWAGWKILASVLSWELWLMNCPEKTEGLFVCHLKLYFCQILLPKTTNKYWLMDSREILINQKKSVFVWKVNLKWFLFFLIIYQQHYLQNDKMNFPHKFFSVCHHKLCKFSKLIIYHEV